VTVLASQSDSNSVDHPPGGNGAVGTRVGADKSVGELTAQLGEQVSRLVRDELALAQTEAKQRAKRIGVGLSAFGVAGGLAFFAGCCLVAALVIGLSNVMRPWLAAIVAAGGLLLLAVFIVMPGWKGMMERRPPVPQDTVESVKADVAAVKEGIHRHRKEEAAS
jgi:putative superfamily III holin-X